MEAEKGLSVPSAYDGPSPPAYDGLQKEDKCKLFKINVVQSKGSACVVSLHAPIIMYSMQWHPKDAR